MRYKRAAGCSRTYWPCVHEENFWTSGTVCIILRDERYLGKTVFGKRERDKVGLVHTVKKSKSDWIVVDDVHEPIVSEELFQAAQAAMREYTERSITPSPRNPLRRKVTSRRRLRRCLMSKKLANLYTLTKSRWAKALCW